MAKKSNEKTINVLPTCSPHSAIHQIADDYAAFRRKETKAPHHHGRTGSHTLAAKDKLRAKFLL